MILLWPKTTVGELGSSVCHFLIRIEILIKQSHLPISPQTKFLCCQIPTATPWASLSFYSTMCKMLTSAPGLLISQSPLPSPVFHVDHKSPNLTCTECMQTAHLAVLAGLGVPTWGRSYYRCDTDSYFLTAAQYPTLLQQHQLPECKTHQGTEPAFLFSSVITQRIQLFWWLS